MLKKVALAFVALLLIFMIVVATRPDDFRIERSATIAAPADVAFAMVDDFHGWPQWSPWEKLDPAMKRTHSGAARGVGAEYAWESEKVGTGKMKILESRPGELLKIQLDFIKPWEASNVAEFSFKPAGANVTMTWAMIGKNNFMAKAAGMFMNMDAMVGADFEKGLAAIKTLAEAEAKKRAEQAAAASEAQAAAGGAAATATP